MQTLTTTLKRPVLAEECIYCSSRGRMKYKFPKSGSFPSGRQATTSAKRNSAKRDITRQRTGTSASRESKPSKLLPMDYCRRDWIFYAINYEHDTEVKDEGGRMKDEVRQNGNYGSDLRVRTKQYALRVIHLCESLPHGLSPSIIGKQLFRSGTSVGSQYREAKRAKSNADLINKIEGSLQELDESAYWLELLSESKIMRKELLEPLMKETDELLAVLTTVVKKVKSQK